MIFSGELVSDKLQKRLNEYREAVATSSPGLPPRLPWVWESNPPQPRWGCVLFHTPILLSNMILVIAFYRTDESRRGDVFDCLVKQIVRIDDDDFSKSLEVAVVEG